MKIIDNRNYPTTDFCNIYVGDAFMYKELLYIKTSTEYAFCFHTKTESCFEDMITVAPVEIIISIEKD